MKPASGLDWLPRAWSNKFFSQVRGSFDAESELACLHCKLSSAAYCKGLLAEDGIVVQNVGTSLSQNVDAEQGPAASVHASQDRQPRRHAHAVQHSCSCVLCGQPSELLLPRVLLIQICFMVQVRGRSFHCTP